MPLPRIAETLGEHLFQKISDWTYSYPHLDELYEPLKTLDSNQLDYIWKKLQTISEKRLETEDFNDPSMEEIRSIIENSKRLTFFKNAVSEVIH